MTFQYDRQVERQVLKLFLTQTFPLCGAMCLYIAFKDDVSAIQHVHFVYRSVEVY